MEDVFKKLLALLSSGERMQLFFIFIAIVCMAFIEMAGIASIMPFMSMVSNPEMVETNRWLKQIYDLCGFSNRQSFLVFLGVIVLMLLVFSNIFKALTTWMTLSYDNRLNYILARRLLANYLSQPYVFFLNRNTADMGKNILNEVRTVIAGVLSPCMGAFSSSLVCLCILALLLYINPIIAVTIIIVLGGAYAGLYVIVHRRLSVIGQEQVEANFMKFKIAGEALSGIKDLKVLGREYAFLDEFTLYARRHARNNVCAGIISQLPRFFLEIMAFGGILLIVLHFIATEKGVTDIVPLLALYAFAGYRLLPALQQVFSSVTTMRFNLPSLNVLHDDLVNAQIDAFSPSIYLSCQEKGPIPFQYALELRDVSFSYPGAHKPALQGVSLIIAPNTTIGFVGPTGSGKTTIIDVILGLLSPSSGELAVDGTIINLGNLSRWQLCLGYVPQFIYLCDDTITRNVAFGVPDDQIDVMAVKRAAKVANLHQFIEDELTDGYATIIGERGVRLSGGQRQRIGIARALYRDPSVLLLDEATSALDGVTEEAVMEAIDNISRKKTIIIIAHRLSTVKNCDVVYILDKGIVKDRGNYKELLHSSSWFRIASSEDL